VALFLTASDRPDIWGLYQSSSVESCHAAALPHQYPLAVLRVFASQKPFQSQFPHTARQDFNPLAKLLVLRTFDSIYYDS
jgi:hypothetical protein